MTTDGRMRHVVFFAEIRSRELCKLRRRMRRISLLWWWYPAFVVIIVLSTICSSQFILWRYPRFVEFLQFIHDLIARLTYSSTIYTQVIPLTSHLWWYTGFAQFRQYPRIDDYFGNLWRRRRYHGFHRFWRDIVEFFIFFLIMTGIWTFYWFCRYRAFPHHSLSVARAISKNRIIFLQLTMWRYRSIFLWLFCFWWHPQLIRFMTTISSYSRFWCVWRYFAFLDLSVFRRYTSISFILDHSW